MTPRLREKLDRLLADRRHALRRAGEEREALEAASAREAAASEAQKIAQAAAEQTQAAATARIASVVTRCVRACGWDYDFRVEFKRLRGKTEARLQLVRGGNVIEEPTGAAGGGVVDVAALALRIACLALARPARRRLLVLDEPLKSVHGTRHRELAAELLAALAEEFETQIVLATGLEWLQEIGKVVDLSDR